MTCCSSFQATQKAQSASRGAVVSSRISADVHKAAHPVLKLQRQIGNRAVGQMLQAKMTVGKANDVYEQEADRVADTVMRMPEPLVQPAVEEDETAQARPLQRQTEEEEPQAKFLQRQVEEEDTAQTKPLLGGITPLLQRQTEQEDDVQAQPLQRQTEEDGVQAQPLQRQTDEEEAQAKLLQRQAEEEDTTQAKPIQRQAEEEEPQAKLVQRQSEEEEPQAKLVQRQAEEEETAQTKGEAPGATPTVSTNLESSIQAMRGGGQPLPGDTRDFYESRMGYDLGRVRIHTDASAHEATTQLNAQAFTLGRDVFFGTGRFEPQTNSGKWLLAHELTHTVQQSPQPLRRLTQPKSAPRLSPQQFRKQQIQTQALAIARRPTLAISSAPPQIQGRLGVQLPGLSRVLNWAANQAAHIPGFTVLTVILGRNPINNQPVPRSALNLIRGVLGLAPGGELLFQGLQNSGAIEPVAHWLRQQVNQLNLSWEGIVALFKQALQSLRARDILDIPGAANRILDSFRPTLDRLRSLTANVGRQIVQFIKEAILHPVRQFAQRLPFYPLLTVILGRDPITSERVERNATNVIRGILLIVPGGEERFQNLQRSGVLNRAYAWFSEQFTRLNLTWSYIKSLFSQLWETLSIRDVLSPGAAFERIRNIFGEPIGRLTSFAGAAIRKVAEFVFEGVLTLAGGLGQQVLGIFSRARGALANIIQDPIGFIGNLVTAVKRGFQQFAGNILTHLRGGLIGWLMGALASSGLQLPERFDLRGIVSLVMQVLGLTYQRLRTILVRLLGSEERVQRAEQVFDFLTTLVREGIGAAWERIVEFVGNLRDMVLGGIRDWVARSVVGRAIARLVTLFNPAGAVIQSIMAIYNTIVFFIERAQQIAALVESVFDSITTIAAGNVTAAVAYIERSMARTIPVILGFLARFIGLGNVGEQIQAIIRRIQAPIERALEKMANWVVLQVRRLVERVSPNSHRSAENGNNVKGHAVQQLRKHLQEKTHPRRLEVQEILSQIHRDLRSRGLQRFELGSRKENGEYSVIAEASPAEEVFSLKFFDEEENELSIIDVMKRNFGERIFTKIEAIRVGEDARIPNILRLLNDWSTSGELQMKSPKDSRDPVRYDLYCFGAGGGKLGFYKKLKNRRSHFGYQNSRAQWFREAVLTGYGRALISKHLVNSPPTGNPSNPMHPKNSVWLRTEALFRCVQSGKHIPWNRAIMGHRISASKHWNKEGHMCSKEVNQHWNQGIISTFDGPEDASLSSASGSKEDYYLIPHKAINSNSQWL